MNTKAQIPFQLRRDRPHASLASAVVLRAAKDVRDTVPLKADRSRDREAYFGRRALAEPVHGREEGPPYVVCSYPNHDYIHVLDKVITLQDEISLAFSREEAEKAVRRHDRKQIADSEPTLFDHA